MSDSSEDDVDETLGAAASKFPRLYCEEVDALFADVARGKSDISNFQTRKIVAEKKTFLEMTFKKVAPAAGENASGAADAATSSERAEEVVQYLERVAKGELDLKEFTVRNVLKGETYLRLELAPKIDAEAAKKEKGRNNKKSKKRVLQDRKKSKKEIQEMENELSHLQARLEIMQNLAAASSQSGVVSPSTPPTRSTPPPSSVVSPTAASTLSTAPPKASAAEDEISILTSAIGRITSRAGSGGGAEGHVPYESTPELESLNRKSEQIGGEIIALLKEAEALMTGKEEAREGEALIVGDVVFAFDADEVAETDDVGADVVADAEQTDDAREPPADATVDAAEHIDSDEVTETVDVGADVVADAEQTDDAREPPADAAVVAAEDIDAHMKAHVASLEQEASEMEDNIMRLINTVTEMAKRVEDKSGQGEEKKD